MPFGTLSNYWMEMPPISRFSLLLICLENILLNHETLIKVSVFSKITVTDGNAAPNPLDADSGSATLVGQDFM